MKNPMLTFSLAALTLLVPAFPIQAQEDTAPPRKAESKTESKAASQAKAKAAAAKAKAKAKAKAEADAKRIDINGATKAQLKTVSGLTDADVDKIIAGRPYLTKAHLVTNNVLPASTYQAIRHYIEARQPGVKR